MHQDSQYKIAHVFVKFILTQNYFKSLKIITPDIMTGISIYKNSKNIYVAAIQLKMFGRYVVRSLKFLVKLRQVTEH